VATASAEKLVEKATTILDIIGEWFVMPLGSDPDLKQVYSVCTRV
jgi:hypothetical protein